MSKTDLVLLVEVRLRHSETVMNQLEGRSIAFVNLFLFTIYFTYIIIGGVIFMWLEKPQEELVCAKLAEDYAKLNELQKASEVMQNRSQSLGIDVPEFGDDPAELTNYLAQLFLKKRRRRKRQEWWDEDYITNKIAEVKEKFKVDDYKIIPDMMTYEESIDRCQEMGNYKLAVTTNFEELFFVHHHVAGGEKMKFWLQLRENGDTPCDSKCWTYRLSSYNRFNYHVKDWKRHPNFRFLNCNKRAYALCKKTVPDCKRAHPCIDNTHSCPAQSMCVPTSKSDFKVSLIFQVKKEHLVRLSPWDLVRQENQ